MTCLASRDGVQPASFGCRPSMLRAADPGLVELGGYLLRNSERWSCAVYVGTLPSRRALAANLAGHKPKAVQAGMRTSSWQLITCTKLVTLPRGG